jgi:hypothetical protein
MNKGDGSAEAELPAPSIDLERLADKVYRLLQAEARLGLARGEAAPPRSNRRTLGE